MLCVGSSGERNSGNRWWHSGGQQSAGDESTAVDRRRSVRVGGSAERCVRGSSAVEKSTTSEQVDAAVDTRSWSSAVTHWPVRRHSAATSSSTDRHSRTTRLHWALAQVTFCFFAQFQFLGVSMKELSLIDSRRSATNKDVFRVGPFGVILTSSFSFLHCDRSKTWFHINWMNWIAFSLVLILYPAYWFLLWLTVFK